MITKAEIETAFNNYRRINQNKSVWFGDAFEAGALWAYGHLLKLEINQPHTTAEDPPCLICAKPCKGGGLCCSPQCYLEKNSK